MISKAKCSLKTKYCRGRGLKLSKVKKNENKLRTGLIFWDKTHRNTDAYVAKVPEGQCQGFP